MLSASLSPALEANSTWVKSLGQGMGFLMEKPSINRIFVRENHGTSRNGWKLFVALWLRNPVSQRLPVITCHHTHDWIGVVLPRHKLLEVIGSPNFLTKYAKHAAWRSCRPSTASTLDKSMPRRNRHIRAESWQYSSNILKTDHVPIPQNPHLFDSDI